MLSIHSQRSNDLRNPVALAILAAVIAVGASCSDDNSPAKSADSAIGDTAAGIDTGLLSDTSSADQTTTDTHKPLPTGKHVGADLSAHLPSTTAKGAYLRPFKAGDTFSGSAAQARVGDWIIGNGDVRYAIQGEDRHIGVCPWGGNPIDGSARRTDGTWSDDEMGEHCLLFNLGRTLKPVYFEVLADGAAGGPAVLAVTGEDTLLDFINLPSLLSSFPLFGDDLELPMNPDADVPLTITRYYILSPTERALRVVTAFRNDGAAELVLGVGELIDSGGEVEFFNPAASSKGFGSGSGGFAAQKLDFLAFRSPRGSHAYATPPVAGSVGGSYLAIGGAAGVLLGTDALLPLLLGGKAKFNEAAAARRVAAGAIMTSHNLVVAGTGSLSSISEPIWQVRGVALREVTGTAVDPQGEPVAGARISLLLKGAAHTQVVAGQDGGFSVKIPAGAGWELLGWHPGYGVSDLVEATDTPTKLVFGDSGRLDLTVNDGAGKPRPAKVTLYCKGACQQVPQTLYDSGRDRPGDGAWQTYFVGMDGKLQVPLPVGDYAIVVSGGPTTSLWPTDAHTAGGAALVIFPGKTSEKTAVLRQAVDTTGWLSGDFHVHAINSPDSPVENRRRVRTFLAEGVDVLVATDHDYITDMRPYIKAENATTRLTTLAGVEVTPFDYGHFNSFPLKHDPTDLAGGALDWAGGAGKGLDPPAIRAAMSQMGDGITPVVQINHPGSYMSAAQVDVLGGISYGSRAGFRVTDTPSHPGVDDKKTGNTGMFSDDFDALELLTGHRGGGFGGDGFAQVVNWWFTLLSRGVRWTATAVSDGHSAISSQAGGARSYVFVGQGKDTVATFDLKTFTAAIHSGKVVGCDGPFVRIWAESAGKKAAVGDTLAVALGAAVTVTVDVQAPYWMDVSRVELYVTPTQTFAPVGTNVDQLPTPFATKVWTVKEKQLTAGFDPKTQRWHLQAVFELTGDGKDGYVMAMVHGDKSLPAGLVAGKDVKPLAFTNPLFLDGDGGGYDHPPLKKTIQPKPAPPPPPTTGRPGKKRPPTYDEWLAVIRELHHD